MNLPRNPQPHTKHFQSNHAQSQKQKKKTSSAKASTSDYRQTHFHGLPGLKRSTNETFDASRSDRIVRFSEGIACDRLLDSGQSTVPVQKLFSERVSFRFFQLPTLLCIEQAHCPSLKNLPGCSLLPIPPLMNCILHYDKSSAHLLILDALPTSLIYIFPKTEMTKKTRRDWSKRDIKHYSMTILANSPPFSLHVLTIESTLTYSIHEKWGHARLLQPAAARFFECSGFRKTPWTHCILWASPQFFSPAGDSHV